MDHFLFTWDHPLRSYDLYLSSQIHMTSGYFRYALWYLSEWHKRILKDFAYFICKMNIRSTRKSGFSEWIFKNYCWLIAYHLKLIFDIYDGTTMQQDESRRVDNCMSSPIFNPTRNIGYKNKLQPYHCQIILHQHFSHYFKTH